MEQHASKLRVLVVDDEPAILALMEDVLSDRGFECRTCASGREALELLKESPFDLVISDLQMPHMTGLELLDRVRREYPWVAFIMLTGSGELRVGVEAMKLGAEDYLVKPFQMDAVSASIHRAIEKKRLQLELERYRRHLEEMVDQRTEQLQVALKHVETTYDETLQALWEALALRDNETAGHSQRVTSYCLKIAMAMGYDTDELKQLARGAYLHDIGKIGIPDAILLKPGKLTLEETTVMQQHVRIGYNLVSRISFLADAADIVLTHQERYDGTGYPQGLIGNDIPRGARVFAVADTLDAMTSDRPYRRALSFSHAQKEIMRESGRQFDPEVVRSFHSFPLETWEEIRSAVAGQLAPSSSELFWPAPRGLLLESD